VIALPAARWVDAGAAVAGLCKPHQSCDFAASDRSLAARVATSRQVVGWLRNGIGDTQRPELRVATSPCVVRRGSGLKASRTRIRFRKSREKISQSTAFLVNKKQWPCGVGTSLSLRLLVAIMPRCRSPKVPAAAPNTYWDSRGHDPEGFVATGQGGSVPDLARCCSVPVFPAIHCGWLIPRRDVPFWLARGRGRRRGLIPGVVRGGGTSERGTWVSQLVKWPAVPCFTFGTAVRREPVGVTPVH
jgi:hypothetical protein